MDTRRKTRDQARRRVIEAMVKKEYPYPESLERAREEIVRLREASLDREGDIREIIGRIKREHYVTLDWGWHREDVEVFRSNELIEDLTNILKGKVEDS